MFATLASAGYFKYQEYSNNDTNDVVGASDIVVSNAVIRDPSRGIGKSTFVKNALINKVDIFEIYKKPTLTPDKSKLLTHLKVIVKPSPIIAIIAPTVIPTPAAPAIPFKYIGKIFGDDEYQVFVGFNGKNFVVKEGDIVQQTYKIEKISPPMMTLTYIPMNVLQSMQIGEPN
ncbi:hypothetical protein [Methylotenera sp.]|uniref:hypothetical protein n=1 Tax=Methylotenera sp. TaxID=2051956 RepID=UPI0025EE4B0F|nr:hypothetical protein [Methylotenera sp.]